MNQIYSLLKDFDKKYDISDKRSGVDFDDLYEKLSFLRVSKHNYDDLFEKEAPIYDYRSEEMYTKLFGTLNQNNFIEDFFSNKKNNHTRNYSLLERIILNKKLFSEMLDNFFYEE